jgi:hypothetical protein
VTPLSELRLYAFRKPWNLAPFVPRSILTAPRVERRQKRLARGWVCHGFLRERRDELDGLWVAHAFVLPPRDRTDAVLVLRTYDLDGTELARSWRRVRNVDPGDGLLAVSFDVLSIPRRAQWSWTLSVATEGWE